MRGLPAFQPMIPDPTSPTGGSTPDPTPPPSERAEFDQALANELTESATLLGAALASPEVLAQISYTQAEIEEGVALHASAQGAFNVRQQSVSTARAKLEARGALYGIVRDDFSAYRATVQANFPATVRTALGASGRVPTDLQKFITLLRSAYAAAQQPAYADTLAKRKLTSAVITARLAQVSELESLDGQAKAADKGATAATKTRDTAGKALRQWIAAFRKQIKADLRKFPDLRAVLGV
jgi:hypothetical protein